MSTILVKQLRLEHVPGQINPLIFPEIAPMPADVLAHYAEGYTRRFVDVITEAKAFWPERDPHADVWAYLDARDPDEDAADALLGWPAL